MRNSNPPREVSEDESIQADSSGESERGRRMSRKESGAAAAAVSPPDLLIIDGSAPFFVPLIDGTRKNWSKAPLPALQVHGKIPAKTVDQICAALTVYCRRVRAIGYNAITFDDLAHLTMFDFYPYMLSRTVHSYQKLFRRVFKIARAAGLKIFITTDLMFWNSFIEEHVAGKDRRLRELFAEAVERLFDLFPQVDGLVTRIGEPDGVDVSSLFKSRMVIRSTGQCNRWLQAVLPVFEAQGKRLIFRTWSLGAFSIGDINWNVETQKRAFAGIDSPAFIVSHKYGAADFFRFIPLGEFFRVLPHMQIIELQARREYEGFGVFSRLCRPPVRTLSRCPGNLRHLVRYFGLVPDRRLVAFRSPHFFRDLVALE